MRNRGEKREKRSKKGKKGERRSGRSEDLPNQVRLADENETTLFQDQGMKLEESCDWPRRGLNS